MSSSSVEESDLDETCGTIDNTHNTLDVDTTFSEWTVVHLPPTEQLRGRRISKVVEDVSKLEDSSQNTFLIKRTRVGEQEPETSSEFDTQYRDLIAIPRTLARPLFSETTAAAFRRKVAEVKQLVRESANKARKVSRANKFFLQEVHHVGTVNVGSLSKPGRRPAYLEVRLKVSNWHNIKNVLSHPRAPNGEIDLTANICVYRERRGLEANEETRKTYLSIATTPDDLLDFLASGVGDWIISHQLQDQVTQKK